MDDNDTDTDEQTTSSAPFLEEEDDEGGMDDEDDNDTDDNDDTSDDSAANEGMMPSGSTDSSAVRVIEVDVANWAFNPTTITAKKGEKVQLKLVGDTGIHGFTVPGLSMNVRVEAGKTVVVDLPTDTVGSFEAKCSIPCGDGHKDMKATIVITA